jgi:hypothetical protein
VNADAVIGAESRLGPLNIARNDVIGS